LRISKVIGKKKAGLLLSCCPASASPLAAGLPACLLPHCACDPGSPAQVCTQPPSMVDGSRVLQLHFGDPRITQWNTLTGTISPSLANLSCGCLLAMLLSVLLV
jgi:hypothetical protein